MRGYTLLDLLSVLAIVSVLVLIVPGVANTWVAYHQLQSQRTTFLALVNTARISAAMHNRAVTLCPAAQRTCGPRDSWHLGTLAFFDGNNNRRADTDEPIVARLDKLEHTRVRWRSFRNRSYLKFNATGFTNWQNGHFLFCHRNRSPRLARSVTLNHAGRTYPSRDSDGDGVHEDAAGRPLVC